MSRSKANLTLVIITVIWGSTFVIVKAAVESSGPYTFVAWRFVLAALTMLLLFRRRLGALTRAEIGAGALLGLWLTLGYTFQTIGLQFTTTGKAGFITGLSVVIVPIMAALLLRRPPRRNAVLGVVVATVGLALLSLDAAWQIQPGDLWVLACAVMFAAHIVTVDQLTRRFDTVRLSAVQITAGAIFATAAALMFGRPSLALSPAVWGAITFTGVIATAFVFTAQIHVQRFTSPTSTALIFSLEPVFAAFFGWWWAGELLGPRELLGCALILAGMLLAELRGAAGAE